MLAESTLPEHSLTKLLVWLQTSVSLLFLTVWWPFLPPCDLAQLRKRIIYSWSVSSCQRAQIQGTGGGQRSLGPHVGSTDVGVNRLAPPLLKLVTAPLHTCLSCKLWLPLLAWKKAKEINKLTAALKQLQCAGGLLWHTVQSMSIYFISHYGDLTIA